MALLADLYISTPAQAVGYDTNQSAPQEDRAQYKSFSPLELSILQSLLEGREWDVSLMDAFTCILERDGGERLIHQLPDGFRERLASLDDGAVTAASEAWAKTEELACAPAEVRPVIADLRCLALRARSSGRAVFLWNCV
jgi:hypothetical protein